MFDLTLAAHAFRNAPLGRPTEGQSVVLVHGLRPAVEDPNVEPQVTTCSSECWVKEFKALGFHPTQEDIRCLNGAIAKGAEETLVLVYRGGGIGVMDGRANSLSAQVETPDSRRLFPTR